MTSEPSARAASIADIFLQALEIRNLGMRTDFLDKSCGVTGAGRDEVEALLEVADEIEEDFLDPARFPQLLAERIALGRDLSHENRRSDMLGRTTSQLGDYQFLEFLGRGEMGAVFKAKQSGPHRIVAVKVILISSLASASDRQRFRLGIETAAKLSHRHVLPIYEVGDHEGLDFYSMMYVPGGSLSDHLARIGADRRGAVSLVAKVADAVHAAHELGVLHGDLKPDNILVDGEGEPLVADFGMDCRMEHISQLSIAGKMMGSPRYMAPEQAGEGGGLITHAADIHSLGSILYELLAGQPAFGGDCVDATLQQVREVLPNPPGEFCVELESDLESITMKCLEKEPGQRYLSARELGDDLLAWLGGEPSEARAGTAPGRAAE